MFAAASGTVEAVGSGTTRPYATTRSRHRARAANTPWQISRFVSGRGPGVTNMVITLSVTGWTLYARLVRGETLVLRSRDFVEAIRAAGAGEARIMFRHVLPNVITPTIVVATFAVGSMV
ncbi:MAG: ABC transporter permease subunit, partial [Candidatus Rokubacteria bacterium]|nr:ABC transporter permease subunit [Candidatus Rokubacteria bacterium]